MLMMEWLKGRREKEKNLQSLSLKSDREVKGPSYLFPGTQIQY